MARAVGQRHLQSLLSVAVVLVNQHLGQVLEEVQHVLVDVPQVLEYAAGGSLDDVLCLRYADSLELDSSLVLDFLYQFECLAHVEGDACA